MNTGYRMAISRGLPLLAALMIMFSSTRNSDGGSANIAQAMTTAKAEDIPIGAIYR